MRRIVALAVLAAVAGLSSAASAHEAVYPARPDDDTAYRAILNKDWKTAEQQLLAGLYRSPDNVFRKLNLAWVYAQTGRKAEAAQLYQQVIDADRGQVAALSSRQGASAKSLAMAGLTRLEATP